MSHFHLISISVVTHHLQQKWLNEAIRHPRAMANQSGNLIWIGWYTSYFDVFFNCFFFFFLENKYEYTHKNRHADLRENEGIDSCPTHFLGKGGDQWYLPSPMFYTKSSCSTGFWTHCISPIGSYSDQPCNIDNCANKIHNVVPIWEIAYNFDILEVICKI